jgi:hypothetical protein
VKIRADGPHPNRFVFEWNRSTDHAAALRHSHLLKVAGVHVVASVWLSVVLEDGSCDIAAIVIDVIETDPAMLEVSTELVQALVVKVEERLQDPGGILVILLVAGCALLFAHIDPLRWQFSRGLGIARQIAPTACMAIHFLSAPHRAGGHPEA